MTINRLTQGGQSEASKAGLQEITVALERLIVGVGELESKVETSPPSHITAYIDGSLADDFRIFADGRDAITAEYGLPVFAEVMTQFSAGERAINRAWSAAADGYIDEVATCVERGKQFLEVALVQLKSAQSAD